VPSTFFAIPCFVEALRLEKPVSFSSYKEIRSWSQAGVDRFAELTGMERGRAHRQRALELLVKISGLALSTHGRLQVLHNVESGILAQQGMAHQRNQIGRRMAGGEVAGREPRSFRDLLLAVAGIEERAPKLRTASSARGRRAGR
jgi:hypothetical protein